MDSWKKRTRGGIKADLNAATDEIYEWYKIEREKLATSGLGGAELDRAKLALTMEAGKRYKKAESRAKYRNNPIRIMERQAREAIERDRAPAD